MEVSFRGVSPKTEKAAFVAPNATISGDVTLEEGVTVWFGAVIRTELDPMVIGKNTNIQDNCVLHCDVGYPLRLGENVTLGHGAIVHGCTVGNDVLVGMHATILNGAVIGDGAIIAAGAVVKEHMQVPPGALVAGVPAKVIRQNGPEMAEKVRANAQHYVDWGGEYRQLFRDQ